MTREKAIDICMEVQHYLTSGNPIWDKNKVGEALEMAIGALKAEPQKKYPTEWCEQCARWEDNRCIGVAQCKRIIEALKQVTSEDLISRVETINAITETLDAIDHVPKWVFDKLTSAIEILPPADRPKGEWTTDEVAELLANVFGDECACNLSGNDEWLPEVCKYAETTCPSPKEANGCWKQFLIQGGAGWVRR